MKLTSLITSLLLASSGAALADHDMLTKESRPVDELGWRSPSRLSWRPLTQMITAERTNTIRVANDRDELRALQLQTGTGATYIYSVSVRYDDGSRERIAVNKWLYWGVPTFKIDLPRRRVGVERIDLHTWTWYPSTYQVIGQHAIELAPQPPLPPPLPPPPPYGGVTIGKDLTFANSAGYVQVPVGAEQGTFGKLRIEGTGAITYFGRVYVTFTNGAHQTLELDKALTRGESVTLDLNGGRSAIRMVTVMAGDDLRAVGHASSRFALSLL